ncbi:transglutaminase domain-containing protein [Clostridium sardiniense]|uniref:transglutaminase domain-containing protein n=1 Tax=Clostridium sardiniense TaxID=29369 RepID=UPI003D348EE1
MNFNLAQIIIFIIMAFMLITSIKNSMISRNLDEVITAIIGSIASVLSFFVMFSFYNFFNSKVDKFLLNISPEQTLNGLIKVLIFITIFFVVKWIIYVVLRLINSIFDFNFNDGGAVSGFLLFVLSTVLGIIRGALAVLCILIAIVTYNGCVSPRYQIDTFSNLNMYNKLTRLIDEQKISKIKSGLVEDISKSTVIYYNGVTLEQGIKSNSEIDKKAKEITAGDKTDREKAKSIYNWVGSNIKYDYNKADMVMSSNNVKNSGAIPAFKEREGICFDYACLYVAMCRAVGLNVRMVMGDAYNGEEYISHAWNEVYLKDENKWIKVDPTFYIAGNYFDNKNFDKDHRQKNIAGEW